MATNLLSARHVETAKPKERDYTLKDGGSLFLLVGPNGSKKWRYRYRIGGIANMYALGRYPETTLEQARRARDAARQLVTRGVHPAIDRKARLDAQILANETTFQAVAKKWIESNSAWTDGYRDQVTRHLTNDVFPKIGKLPVSGINANHLRPIILAVAKRGAECTANNIRMWCSQIFAHAATHGLTDNDPTSFLRRLVKRPAVRHNPPLKLAQIPEFLKKLDGFAGYKTTVLAMRLMAYTFVRTVEMRRAEWTHIDLDNAMWTIPAERMKMRNPHLVPLSTQAVEVLRELHSLTGGGKVLFPNYRKPAEKVMSATTLNAALARLGYRKQFSGHGFRSTATTVLGLLGYSEKRVDLQLAHSKKKKDSSRAPYDHTKYVSSRRIIMRDWSDILDDMKRGRTFAEITSDYGPLSARRAELLKVIEREDDE